MNSPQKIWPMRVRHPIIVIEGPDGVGKTTLAEAIVKDIGGKVLHLTYRYPDRMHQYHTAAMYHVIRAATQGPVVLDRWWASELAYASVYRGGSKWPHMWRMLHRVALRFGFYYVWCDAEQNLEAYNQRYNILRGMREEMYDSGMDKVAREFRDLRNGLIYHGAVDYITQFPFDFNVTVPLIIMGAMQRTQRVNRTFLDTSITDVAGNTANPKVILVGDKSNPKGRRTPFPFFEYGNSSLWMVEAMATMGIREVDCMFINAASPDGVLNTKLMQYVNGHYRLSNDVPVVALGLNAAKYWHEATGKPCDKHLSHPAYTRRFNNTNLSDYYYIKEKLIDKR